MAILIFVINYLFIGVVVSLIHTYEVGKPIFNGKVDWQVYFLSVMLWPAMVYNYIAGCMEGFIEIIKHIFKG